MMEVFAGLIIGSLLTIIFYQMIFKRRNDSIKINSHFTIESFRKVGQLKVYNAYIKEIISSVDHIFGETGKKYFSWIISEKKLMMVFEFEVGFLYDLQSQDFKIQEDGQRFSVEMPKSKIEVSIKDFHFLDEQGSKLNILFLSASLGDSFSEQDRNEMKNKAMEQVELNAKTLAEKLQSVVQSSAIESIRYIASGFNVDVESVHFQETKIDDEQIEIEANSI